VAKEPQRYGIVVDTQPPFAYDSVLVGGGVPLASIARAAGVGVDAVTDLNPHFLRGVTPPGEDSEVRLPLGTAAAFATGFAALPDATKRAWREERVAARRSVTAIAEEAGVPLRSLRWYNPRLAVDRRGRVAPGTLVRIPTTDALAAARDVPDPSIERYGRAARGAEVALVSQRHRVRRGETLSGIARRYGVSVAQLRRMNGVAGDRVRVGQTLVVKRPSRSAVAAARRRAATARADDGVRCTSRVVKAKNGTRRTVRRCSPARAGATAGRGRASAAGATTKATGAKRATGTKATGKKTTAKKTTAKKTTAKKTTAKKTTAKKTTAKKTTAKKTPAKKTAAK
jgi:membrane-bound lytic murein transglycosylase D